MFPISLICDCTCSRNIVGEQNVFAVNVETVVGRVNIVVNNKKTYYVRKLSLDNNIFVKNLNRNGHVSWGKKSIEVYAEFCESQIEYVLCASFMMYLNVSEIFRPIPYK